MMQVTLKPGLLQHHELVPLLLPTRRMLLLLLFVVPLLFGLGSGVFFALLLEGFCNELLHLLLIKDGGVCCLLVSPFIAHEFIKHFSPSLLHLLYGVQV
jgi:hypothetical protein